MGQWWSEAYPPKSKFSVDDIPDLSGMVMIVTGGNTGIGKETIKALLKKNAKVYMASRSKQKAEAAIADLREATGKEAIFLDLDLANLKTIKKAAETFLSQETQLHVLFNSGGVMAPPISMLTADGYDLQFGTNVLGHHYLTKLLLPALVEAAQSAPDGKARVVTTSSYGHIFCKRINYATLKESEERRSLGGNRLYPQSKFGNVVVAKELARRYADKGIVSVSCNPGNLRTDLARHLPGPIRALMRLLMWDASYGALTQLWGGVSPETRGCSGKYLIPWARVGPAHPESQDPKVGEELWSWLEEQVKDV